MTGEISASIVKSLVASDILNSIYQSSQTMTDQPIKNTYKPGDKIFPKVGMVLWLKNVRIIFEIVSIRD